MIDLDEHVERHTWLSDAGIVAALFLSTVLGLYLIGPDGERPDSRYGLWVAHLVSAVSCLVVLLGRTRPRTATVVTTVCTVVLGILGFLLTPLLLAPVMAAIYWLAVRHTARTAWTNAGVSTLLIVTAAAGLDADETTPVRALGPTLWLLLPLVMGSRFRLRHAFHDAVQARAEYAERTREEEARLRVAEERMRIARDLHDVVAHHMAVANAQAGTAAHLLPTDPTLAHRILVDLQATTSTVMLELRDTIGVLRTDATQPETLEPAPGLARLPDLVDTCRSAGLAVDVETYGDVRDLPPGVDLTAFRIIQEALTNATKHSASAKASLTLRYSSTRLVIRVANDRRVEVGDASAGAHDDRGGFGILGMRERAHAVRGDLHVTEDDGAVFEVVAALPLGSRPAATAPPTSAADTSVLVDRTP